MSLHSLPVGFIPRQSKQNNHIAVDLDEVLCPMIRCLTKYYKRTRAAPYQNKLPKSYNYASHFKISEIESKHLVKSFYDSAECSSMKPLDGSQEAISLLRENFGKLSIVTGRQYYAADATYEFLDSHFPGLFADVIFTNSFALDGPREISKQNVCTYLGAGLLIDDNLDTCLTTKNSVIFGDYPWNEDNTSLPRISSWKDVTDIYTQV